MQETRVVAPALGQSLWRHYFFTTVYETEDSRSCCQMFQSLLIIDFWLVHYQDATESSCIIMKLFLSTELCRILLKYLYNYYTFC